MSGKVKWFNDEKGYGFISSEGKSDIFVHFSTIDGKGHRSLTEGQLVLFDLLETPKGLQALNVKQSD